MKRTPIAFFLCAGLLIASTAFGRPRSVSPALDHVQPGSALSERFLARDAAGTVLVNLFIEGTVPPGLLRARGIQVNTVAGRLMTARCPLGLLRALLEMPGVDRVQVAEPAEPYLDQSIPDVNAEVVRTVPPPAFDGQTGAGVLVGIVDTGLDLDHLDFRDASGNTRLVSLWDQTDTGGPPPSGYTYGTEWTAAQIDAGSSREVDVEGHGSHVMGIIAGNGSATGNGQPAYQFVGVAPEADLCVVKTTFSTSSIADGVAYVFQRASALGKQAVVNLSLGTQAGPHDGTYPQDEVMSSLCGPGRIIVASAGNKGLDNLHGKLVLPPSTPLAMTLNLPSYQKTPGTSNDYLLFSGWYEGADEVSLTIVTPGGITLGPVPTGAELTGQNTGDGYLNIYNGTTAPSNGDNEIYVELFDAFANKTPQAGTWTFTFTPVALGSTGRVDMYLYGNHLGDGSSLAMWVDGLDPEGVVGSPGTADSVIAVAAHTTKDCWTSIDGNRYCWNPRPPLNAIADFSSHGPRRDGAQKPDLSAPGNSVMSSKSASYPIPSPYIAPDGQHFNQPGTSMSSPHVAGAVALLLAQPYWTGASAGAVKARVQSTARSDAYTGAVPNPAWGHGKLDVGTLLAPVFTMQIPYPPRGAWIPPGKPDSVLVVTGGLAADSVLVELSLDGGGTYPIALGTLYGVTPGPPHRLDYMVADSLRTTSARLRGVAWRAAATDTAWSDSLFLIALAAAVEPEGATATPRFALLGNAPNPFNPETAIRFEIERPGPVRLRIYAPSGRLVRTLVDQPLAPGRYRTVWDGRDGRGTPVGSGVYVYEISTQGRSMARKMTLLK